MKLRGNRTLTRLVAVLLVGLAAVVVYRNMAGRAPRALTKPASTGVATPARPAPALRAAPSAPAAPAPGGPGGASPAGTPPKAAGTPPSAGTAAPSGASAPGAPPKAGTPAQAPQGAPTPGLSLPANVASTAVNPNSEAALVGKGEQGRADPFTPLATPESGGLSPILPPPPGILPQPPGFGLPGGPGTPPPVGVGMRVAGIMGGRARVAIIEADGRTYIVRAGERIGDAVVVSVLPDRVVVKQNNVTFELSFGGA